MNSKNRMSVRRSLIPLALAVCAAAAVSCGDPSPTGVPAFQRGGRGWYYTSGPGLVPCTQTYDSVTQVIGPAGGPIAGGPHYLGGGSRAVSGTVSIPAGGRASTG